MWRLLLCSIYLSYGKKKYPTQFTPNGIYQSGHNGDEKNSSFLEGDLCKKAIQ